MKTLGSFIADRLRIASKDAGTVTVTATGIALRPDSSSSPENLRSRLSSALASERKLSGTEAKKLTDSLVAFASSDDFSDAVTQAVTPPTAGESEDAFVKRAKAQIRSILLAKFR
jgi:hypothetical protein